MSPCSPNCGVRRSFGRKARNASPKFIWSICACRNSKARNKRSGFSSPIVWSPPATSPRDLCRALGFDLPLSLANHRQPGRYVGCFNLDAQSRLRLFRRLGSLMTRPARSPPAKSWPAGLTQTFCTPSRLSILSAAKISSSRQQSVSHRGHELHLRRKIRRFTSMTRSSRLPN
jgi:hypothetical protein